VALLADPFSSLSRSLNHHTPPYTNPLGSAPIAVASFKTKAWPRTREILTIFFIFFSVVLFFFFENQKGLALPGVHPCFLSNQKFKKDFAGKYQALQHANSL